MTTDAVRSLMWNAAGLFRTRADLEAAAARLDREAAREPSADPAGLRLRNLATVARLITRAALRREESRGGHFREDFPARDDIHWKIHYADCLTR
jgi:L-aspartate oxidase